MFVQMACHVCWCYSLTWQCVRARTGLINIPRPVKFFTNFGLQLLRTKKTVFPTSPFSGFITEPFRHPFTIMLHPGISHFSYNCALTTHILSPDFPALLSHQYAVVAIALPHKSSSDSVSCILFISSNLVTILVTVTAVTAWPQNRGRLLKREPHNIPELSVHSC